MIGKKKLEPGVVKLVYQPRTAAEVIFNPPKLPEPKAIPAPVRASDPPKPANGG